MPRFALPVLAATLLLTACGGDSGGGTGPDPDPLPVITITGVEDGATYTSAVTISIAVDRGTYAAELNGQEIFSGHTVSDPDDYTLEVEARNGTRTNSVTLDFSLVLGGDSFLTIRLLDLGPNEAGGGGDAILLTDSSALVVQHMMVDAGPAGVDGSDRDYVAERLTALGVERLEALILTHAHSDHYQGIPDLYASGIGVERFYYNGQIRNLGSYNTAVGIALAQSDTTIIPEAPETFSLINGGSTEITVLPALGTYLTNPNAESSELNEGSVGAALERGSFTMFFTGDGEVEANLRWRTQYAGLTADLDVLKVGHHGANDAIFDNGFSGASSWLDHTDPDVQVISSNGTSHPRNNALTRLLSRTNTRTYCTNVHGEIVIRVNPEGDYEVQVEKNSDSDCVPGSGATT